MIPGILQTFRLCATATATAVISEWSCLILFRLLKARHDPRGTWKRRCSAPWSAAAPETRNGTSAILGLLRTGQYRTSEAAEGRIFEHHARQPPPQFASSQEDAPLLTGGNLARQSRRLRRHEKSEQRSTCEGEQLNQTSAPMYAGQSLTWPPPQIRTSPVGGGGRAAAGSPAVSRAAAASSAAAPPAASAARSRHDQPPGHHCAEQVQGLEWAMVSIRCTGSRCTGPAARKKACGNAWHHSISSPKGRVIW